MNVFNKILTALRGSVREIGESVVDANATRIYEQEIMDAKHHLSQAKQDLTLVMAKEMQAQRDIARLNGEIAKYEQHALQALDKDAATLAEEVAERIAILEVELTGQIKVKEEFAGNIVRLKELIKQTEAKLREHERELAMAKTTESVYRATQSISQSMHGGGSKLISARESLDRIKQRHTELSDRIKATEQLDNELGDKALDAKLAAAGIGAQVNGKQVVLDRLKAKHRGTDTSPKQDT
ncbi:PspA/IM30 family protein [Chitinivorax sp. B]|uniref:PspA/IM30 family protein n=1 Tax=Chitinivorax sp. B TaxID=2502235 RepID=UPI0010F62B90|nr:PspA/IM30 family protein [Chitinivorax sp. B]